jgi:hypothetical protein
MSFVHWTAIDFKNEISSIWSLSRRAWANWSPIRDEQKTLAKRDLLVEASEPLDRPQQLIITAIMIPVNLSQPHETTHV